jgi:hypothetical protein
MPRRTPIRSAEERHADDAAWSAMQPEPSDHAPLVAAACRLARAVDNGDPLTPLHRHRMGRQLDRLAARSSPEQLRDAVELAQVVTDRALASRRRRW